MEDTLSLSVKHLAALLVTDPSLESAFLGALGNMEEVASREIIKSITPETPKEFYLDIIDHAKDEHRHAFLLRDLKPVKDYTDIRYYQLERKLSTLGTNFVLGFFGQKLLLEARSLNRFAGYVLGALTIEQVPLQLYTGYLKATKLTSVRQGMPAVLKDEFAHLELGKRLYKTLPKDQQFCIDQINAIEMEMCELLARKMSKAVEDFKLRNSPRENSFEEYICSDKKRLALWITLLSQLEAKKGNAAVSADLAHSVCFITNKVVQTIKASDISEYLNSASPMWLRGHYKNLADLTDLVGVSYALEKAFKNSQIKENSHAMNIDEFNHQIRYNLESML